MVAVSSIFSAETLSGIQWPLGPGDCPPLYFESLEAMKQRRLHQATKNINTNEKKMTFLENLDIPQLLQQQQQQQQSNDATTSTSTITNNNDESSSSLLDLRASTEKGQFGRIALSLLLLGHGYTDECHDLITPLSWPDDIHFASGPSLYHQVSSPAVKSFATYTHALVHRKEAFHVGEFGMVGFQNANYWSSAVQQCEGRDPTRYHLPHIEWYESVLSLATAKEGPFHDSPGIQQWCQEHGFMNDYTNSNTYVNNNDADRYFESRAVHQLCATVLSKGKAAATTTTATKDNNDYRVLKEFAEQVVRNEIQILLKHAMERAGISIPTGFCDDKNNVSSNKSNVMESTFDDNGIGGSSSNKNNNVKTNFVLVVNPSHAIHAMKRISSAHLNNFVSDGSIVLRRAVIFLEDGEEEKKEEFINGGEDTIKTMTNPGISAAAGIACRLFQTPACKLSLSSTEDDGATKTAATATTNCDYNNNHNHNNSNNMIHVMIPCTEQGSVEIERITHQSLAVGDAFATTVRTAKTASTSYPETLAKTLNGPKDKPSNHDHQKNIHVMTWTLESCQKDDPNVLFIDPLFGTRGETPTTVIQWSKGTIF